MDWRNYQRIKWQADCGMVMKLVIVWMQRTKVLAKRGAKSVFEIRGVSVRH